MRGEPLCPLLQLLSLGVLMKGWPLSPYLSCKAHCRQHPCGHLQQEQGNGLNELLPLTSHSWSV